MAPDVIVSRDGSTVEVSISRRGLHRIGLALAVAISAWVMWQLVRVPSNLRDSTSPPTPDASIGVMASETRSVVLSTRTPTVDPLPLTVLAKPMIVASPLPTPTRLPALPVAKASLPIDSGYVVSVDGTTTDVRFDWNGPPESAKGDWALEVWLRPLRGPSGTIYGETTASPDAPLTRWVWIDGVDVWVMATGRSDVIELYVARGASAWTANSWHQLAVAWSPDSPLVVTDGVSFPTLRVSAIGVRERGRREDAVGVLFPVESGGGFVGDFDEIRVWNRPRNVKEIGGSRGSRVSADAPGLSRYFPISAGRGSGAVVDDATLLGAPIRLETGARWVAVENPTSTSVSSAAARDAQPVSPQLGEVNSTSSQRDVIVVPNVGAKDATDWVLTGGAKLVGDGWLRLTDASPMQLGIARYERDLPVGAGVTIQFVYRVTRADGPPADGIVAFLWDPSLGPFAAGYGGGSLGYARYCTSGLRGAIFGVAVDIFGTFGSSEPTCKVDTVRRTPNAVSVRGPGHEATGYELIATSPRRKALSTSPGTSTAISVTIKLFADRTLSVDTRDDSETVASQDINRLPLFSSGDRLPTIARFGIAGATGGLFATHDVRDVTVRIGTE